MSFPRVSGQARPKTAFQQPDHRFIGADFVRAVALANNNGFLSNATAVIRRLRPFYSVDPAVSRLVVTSINPAALIFSRGKHDERVVAENECKRAHKLHMVCLAGEGITYLSGNTLTWKGGKFPIH